jgi:PKD repeat protein
LNQGSDPFNSYDNIQTKVYNRLVQLVGQPYTPIKNTPTIGQPAPMAPPTITSFSPTTVTAANGSVLTINGTNFGATAGTNGRVFFANPDDGGTTFTAAASAAIVSWSDTQIQVQVPSKAGTGKIRVRNNTNETGTSTADLTVTFARVSPDPDDLIPSRMFGPNAGGSLQFTLASTFASNASAKAAWERALETWRCGTFVNMSVAANPTTSTNCTNQNDGINIVRFTGGGCTIPNGALGLTASGFQICGSQILVNSVDQIFLSNADLSSSTGGGSWNFSTANATAVQFDFQSVAVHELGHAHQLTHVINSNIIMHYAIGPGVTLRTLNAGSDVAGGNTVRTASTAATQCSQPVMTALNSGNCSLTASTVIAQFTANDTTPVINQTVTFTNQSTGNPTVYQWTITPSTFNFVGGTNATSQNPQVQFTANGSYSVTLQATAGAVNNTLIKTNYITVSTANGYCLPKHGSNAANLGTALDDFINGVQIGTINNQNTGATNGPVYTDYSNQFSTTLTAGQSASLVVTNGTYGDASSYARAFIDYNRDNDFNDAGETIGTVVTLAANQSYTINFTVPVTINPGPTILRVRRYFTGAANGGTLNACDSTNYGETEDYGIVLQPSVTLTANFSATPLNVGLNQTVTFTDQTTNSPTSWSWSFNPPTVTFVGGTTANSQNPQVQFTAIGQYSVTLNASNGTQSDSETKTNYITVSTASAYCVPKHGSNAANLGTSDGDFINGVQIGTINNQNTGATNGPVYTDYSVQFSTTLTAGQAASLVVTNGTYGDASSYARAFIDYNRDNDFNDAGETIGTVVTLAANQSYTINFTVPVTINPGPTILRVRRYFTGAANGGTLNACDSTNYGETEDYGVVLQNSATLTANFSATPLTAFTNQTVAFSDLTTNNPTTWSWSFNPPTVTFVGGTTATSQNPQVKFTAAGQYSVTLNASNGTQSDSETKTNYITVQAAGDCDTLLFELDDPGIFLVPAANGSGYFSGQHSLDVGLPAPIRFSRFANKFTWQGQPQLLSAFYAFGVRESAAPANATVRFFVTDATGPNGSPGTELASINGTYAQITPGQYINVNFPDINLNGDFFVGYEISYATPGDTLAAFQNTPGTLSPNNAWIFSSDLIAAGIAPWLQFNSLFQNPAANTSQYAIHPIVGAAPKVGFTLIQNQACAGQTVTVTTTAQNADAVLYIFPGSGQPGATDDTLVVVPPFQPLTITYNAAGSFNIQQVVLGSCAGIVDTTATNAVVVNAAPTAIITPASPSVCAGQNVTLTASGGNSYSWSSGQTTAAITVAPTTTTTYTVTATGAGGCTDTETVTVAVNPAPTASITPVNPSIQAGNSLTLTASGGATYSWAPGGQSGASISVSPATSTCYTVTATDANGCTATAQTCVTVTPACTTPPTVTASVAPFNITCVGGTVTLSAVPASGVPPYTFNWTPAAGVASPNQQSTSAVVNATTTYTVTVTDANTCTATATVVVTTQPVPPVPFTVTPATICSGGSVTVEVPNAQPGATFNWDFAGGTAVPGGTVAGPHVVTFSTPGSKTISLTVNAQGCVTPQTTQTVSVEAPLATPVANCGNSTQSSVSFTWSAVAGATGYEISLDNGATFQAPAPGPLTHQITGLNAGDTRTLIVRALGSGACGNSANSVPVTCTAQNCTAVTFTAPQNVTQCGTAAVTLALTNLSVPNATVSWAPGGQNGASITVNPTSGTTTYTYTVVDPAQPGCPSVSGTVSITVNPTPTIVALNASSTAVCVNSPTTISLQAVAEPSATYTWDFAGGTAIPGNGVGPHTVSFTTPGTKIISVVVDNGNGCPTATQNVTVNVAGALAAPVVSCGTSTPSSATFNWAPVAGAISYQVSTDGGVTFAAANPGPTSHTVSGLSAGQSVTLTVHAIDGGVCGNGALSAPVTCSALNQNCPNITFTAPQPQTICGTGSATLTISNISPANAVVTWAPGNQIGPTITVSPTGSATYTFTVTDPAAPVGCPPASGTVSVTVAPAAVANFTVTPGTLCVNQAATVAFTGVAGPSATYSWNFGGGIANPGTGAGPHQVTYASAGSKTITLTLNNNNGCPPAVFSQTVEVLGALVAPQVSCATPTATSVVFQWNAVPGAAGYEVSSDGGATFTPANPGPTTHIIGGLNLGDSRTLIVRAVSTTCGNSPVSAPVTCVANNCTPITFTPAGNTEVCQGETVTLFLNDVSIANPTVLWNGPGVVVSPTQYVVTPTSSLNVTATIVDVNNQQCPPVTYTFTVTVKPNPVPSINIDAIATCEGTTQTVSFVGQAGPNAVYNWDFSGGVVLSGFGAGPYEVVWNTFGDKNIVLSIDDNGCVKTGSKQLFVAPKLPAPVVSCGPNTNETQVQFVWNAINGAIGYEVSVNGGQTFTQVSGTSFTVPGLTLNTPVTVIVRPVGNAPCLIGAQTPPFTCIAAKCQPISFDVTPASLTLCPGTRDTIRIFNLSTANFLINWIGQGSVVAGDQTAFVVSPNSTSQVIIMVKDLNQPDCDMVSDTVQVTVNATCASSNFIVSGPAVCSGNTLTVTYTGQAGPTAVFNWNFDGATVLSGSGSGPYTLAWAAQGQKFIRLTITENGLTSSETVREVFVSLGVDVTAVATDVTTPTGNDGSIVATAVGGIPPYRFKLNTGGFVASGFFSELTAGEYTVIVRDSIGCTDTTRVVVGGGLSRGTTAALAFDVYPNPTKGIFTVRLTGINAADAVVIRVYDMVGKEIYSERPVASIATQLTHEVMLPNVSRGVYHVEVQAGERRAAVKLVVN